MTLQVMTEAEIKESLVNMFGQACVTQPTEEHLQLIISKNVGVTFDEFLENLDIFVQEHPEYLPEEEVEDAKYESKIPEGANYDLFKNEV